MALGETLRNYVVGVGVRDNGVTKGLKQMGSGIKDLMGHTNVRTTQIYTHIVNEKKEKAANTLHIDNLNL